MPFVASCTFREKAKTYYLDPGDLEVHVESRIIAQTSRGLELGRVKWLPREVPQDKIIPPLRAIERLATPEDLEIDQENRGLETQAMATARFRIAHFKLPMKVVGAEMLHDRSKMFLFYESEERIDFRELVRDLSSRLNVRLHLQGLNSREVAKLIGGVGVCGQPLCCATFLTSLPPVTLRMAKEQGLGQTPSKISGACGRLMCCLRYEIEFYRDQNQRLPRPGSPVDTPEGPGHIVDVNVISEKCVVRLGDGRYLTVEGETLRALREERGPVKACNNHVDHGGSCGGSAGGGCSSGGCGKDGGCGCSSKKSTNREDAKTQRELEVA